MSKGETKVQLALTEAREWIEAAKEEVAEREQALNDSLRNLSMHETLYAILEKTLTRAPRKAVTKKASKKASSKSLRAASLATAITRSPTHPALQPCAYVPGDGTGIPCDLTESSAIHDPAAGYAGYHPFTPPAASGKPSSKPARPAAEKSGVNGGEGDMSASSVIGMGAAGVVVREASGGGSDD